MSYKLIPYQQLFSFAVSVFQKMGHSAENSSEAARVLLSADLRGVDSHGIARLSGYVRLWQASRVNATPEFKILHQTPSTAVLDADAALGLIAAPYAMNIAIAKANEVGTGWVSVQNSNHFGIAGIHAMMALEKDMIGIAMTNASPLVAPTFAAERLLGTNPIAVAIPAGTEDPFVADMATTTAANGKLEILQRKNLPAPHGWIQDKLGRISTNQHEVKNGGALLPLGGTREQGSHKGYALGSIVDIFSAVLSGANFGPWVPPFVSFIPLAPDMPGKGIGHFFGAMRIDAFRPANEFKEHMDQWIRRFKNAQTIDGEERVLIPGEPERMAEEQRFKDGIPLIDAVVEDIQKLANELAISLNFE